MSNASTEALLLRKSNSENRETLSTCTATQAQHTHAYNDKLMLLKIVKITWLYKIVIGSAGERRTVQLTLLNKY